jgi:hypothetical protein
MWIAAKAKAETHHKSNKAWRRGYFSIQPVHFTDFKWIQVLDTDVDDYTRHEFCEQNKREWNYLSGNFLPNCVGHADKETCVASNAGEHLQTYKAICNEDLQWYWVAPDTPQQNNGLSRGSY